MNAINKLQGMNLQDVYTKLQLSDDEFDEWLVAMRLLQRFQTCDNCGEQMKEDGRNRRLVCNKRQYLQGVKLQRSFRVTNECIY